MPDTVSNYELNVHTVASLERIAASLERIANSLDQMANDDPLSRVERALERAPEVLGFDPAESFRRVVMEEQF